MEDIRYPALKASNKALFELYHNHTLIDARDLKEIFNISDGKAYKIVNLVRDYMTINNIPFLGPSTQKQVLNTILFSVYGWDIKQINSSVKALQKMNQ